MALKPVKTNEVRGGPALARVVEAKPQIAKPLQQPRKDGQVPSHTPQEPTTAKKPGDKSAGERRQSAVHTRLGDVDVPVGKANKKVPVNPTDNPEWFFHGHKRWKVAPEGVEVVVNPNNPNGAGEGWIEKWRSPTNPKDWVHNYTVDEMARKAGLKFVKNAGFGENLDALRSHVKKELKEGGDRATIALVVALIDHTFARMGNEDSTHRNEIEVPDGKKKKENTYGVTTMLGGFLKDDDKGMRLEFTGKKEVPQVRPITDPILIRMLRELKRGTDDAEALFELRAKGNPEDRNAAAQLARAVNEFLEPFGGSAKSFRTFHATRLATEGFSTWMKEHPQSTEAEREAAVNDVAKGVAAKLGHTRAVCLANYINPAIVTLFVEGKLS